MVTKQIELETKHIELETKHTESLKAETKLEEVKLKRSLRRNKVESDSLSRNSSVPSLLSIHEDRPVATTMVTSEAAEIKFTRNAKVSSARQRSTSSILSSNSRSTSSILSSNSSVSSSNASSRVSVNNCKYSEDIKEFNTVNKNKYFLVVINGRIKLVGHKSINFQFHKDCFPKLRTLRYNFNLYLEKAAKNELGAVKDTEHKQRLNDHVIITKDN